MEHILVKTWERQQLDIIYFSWEPFHSVSMSNISKEQQISLRVVHLDLDLS